MSVFGFSDAHHESISLRSHGFETVSPGALRVYVAICDFMHRRGIPPTLRDVMRALKMNSPNSVLCHLKQLRNFGLLSSGEPADGYKIERISPRTQLKPLYMLALTHEAITE